MIFIQFFLLLIWLGQSLFNSWNWWKNKRSNFWANNGYWLSS